jgi:glycosyltransferase involved in cell wall biosynthesis
MKINLSVILAVKNPDKKAMELCINSFCALKHSNNIELIVVSSDESLDLKTDVSSLNSFKVYKTPPDGVYSAYNFGVNKATGDFLLFYGYDDIALPDLDKVIDKIIESKTLYDVIACSSIMQGVGISKPSKYKPMILFKNLCHQGIFYKKSIFKKYKYDIKYLIQADHKLNIQLFSDRTINIHFSELIVSYFSAGGVSSSVPDLIFREDLIKITKNTFGNIFSVIIFFKQRVADILNKNFQQRKKN